MESRQRKLGPMLDEDIRLKEAAFAQMKNSTLAQMKNWEADFKDAENQLARVVSNRADEVERAR